MADLETRSWAACLRPLSLEPLPNEPLVSILIGNYNYARYLAESLKSVFAQTYANWELIVCDDGSTDDSWSVLQTYAEGRDNIILLKKQNGGHASALNKAFSAAKGELICLLDSDDLYRPDKLLSVVCAAQSRPNSGLIVHRVLRVDHQRRPQGVWPLSELPHGWHGNELLRSGGILPYLPPTSGLTLRRELAQLLFPLSTERPVGNAPDQSIMRLAPLATEIAAVPEPLSEYRLHDSNSYAEHRVTPASIGKEITLTRALWVEQRAFLSRHAGPYVSDQLLPLAESIPFVFSEYLAAKLAGGPEAAALHHQYLQLCQRQPKPKWFALWKLSRVFPTPLFRTVANLLLGQSRLKQLVARVRGLV